MFHILITSLVVHSTGVLPAHEVNTLDKPQQPLAEYPWLGFKNYPEKGIDQTHRVWTELTQQGRANPPIPKAVIRPPVGCR